MDIDAMLLRIGLTGLGLSILLLLMTTTQMRGEFQREATIGIYASLGLIALGFVFKMLGAATRSVPLAHCGTCGRSVRRGHIYCADHLKEAIHAAEDAERLNHRGN